MFNVLIVIACNKLDDFISFLLETNETNFNSSVNRRIIELKIKLSQTYVSDGLQVIQKIIWKTTRLKQTL